MSQPIIYLSGKSSYASTDIPVETMGIQAAVEATTQQRFPVDDITQRTPCDLQSAVKNLTFMVATLTLCQPNQATCTIGSRFWLNTLKLAWRKCAMIGRRLSSIFLEVTGRGH